MIEFGHGTHAGLRRMRNEDTYYADAALGLFLVADGIGGNRHGEVAAALVRDTLVERVSRGDALIDAVHAAAARLLNRRRAGAQGFPLGSTLAALRMKDGHYAAVWVGDSRVYQWHGTLQQVSHDPQWVQSLVEDGKLDAAAVHAGAHRHVQTQALGITAADQLQIGMAHGPMQPDTAFLLCTDGLTECLDDACLAHIVGRTDLPAQECVDQLLLNALDCGGDDNVTALLVRCV